MAHRLSGSIQTGPARVEILRELGDGTREYRVVRNIQSHWGSKPKPHALYVQQHGIGPRTEEELVRDFCQGDSIGLFHYYGPEAGFPYCTDEPHPDCCCQRHA